MPSRGQRSRAHQCVLHALLGECEVAGVAGQGSGQAPGLLAEDRGQIRLDVTLDDVQ
jgi:hypothetical protein